MLFQISVGLPFGIRAVRPYRTPCVTWVQQCFKLFASMHMHMHCAHAVTANQPPASIRANMQCLSVPRFAVFAGPTGLQSVLRTLGIAPLRHRVACLDVRMFFAGSAYCVGLALSQYWYR